MLGFFFLPSFCRLIKPNWEEEHFPLQVLSPSKTSISIILLSCLQVLKMFFKEKIWIDFFPKWKAVPASKHLCPFSAFRRALAYAETQQNCQFKSCPFSSSRQILSSYSPPLPPLLCLDCHEGAHTPVLQAGCSWHHSVPWCTSTDRIEDRKISWSCCYCCKHRIM